LALGPEHAAHVGEQRVRQLHQRADIDVDGRPLHGGKHAVRNVGRTRDRQEFTAGSNRHGNPHCRGKSGPLPSTFWPSVRSMKLKGGSKARIASVPIPKFATPCSTVPCELRNRRTLATF